jgi:hypothetical protein
VTGVIETGMWIGAVILAVPSLFFFVQATLSLFHVSQALPGEGDRPKLGVLIHARDAVGVIGPTVQHLKAQLQEGDRIVVIADGSTDGTVSEAEAAGAEVVEMAGGPEHGEIGDHRRAWARGAEHLQDGPPDVVVLLDPDARVSEGGLDRLARRARGSERPVQADYLPLPAELGPDDAMAGLAVAIRNRVRPRGLAVLGLPCRLVGSGMALQWDLFRDGPQGDATRPDDVTWTVAYARQDKAPVYEGDVQVTGPVAGTTEAALERPVDRNLAGESGRSLTARLLEAPGLMGTGLRRFKPSLFGLGLDFTVPPLDALYVMLIGATVFSTAAAWAVGPGPMYVTGASLGLVILGTLVAWVGPAQSVVPLKHMFLVPKRLTGKAFGSIRSGRKKKAPAELPADNPSSGSPVSEEKST